MSGRPPSVLRVRDEEGAFLILFALMLVAMLTMVAIVIDLGAVRNDRRKDRNAADAAATAGALDLSLGSLEACKTAWNYANRNLGFTPGAEPCTSAGFPATCGAAIPPATKVVSGYTISIKNPVPDNDPLMNADTPGGDITQTADAIADGLPCDRIGVQISYTRASIWGRIAGNNQNTTTVHSVARLSPGDEDEPASLVLLERHDCRAARTQGSNTRILVAATLTTPAVPGIIQSDSRGDGSCPGGARILEGGPGPAIKAEHARDGLGNITRRARIGIYGKLFGATNAHTPWPTQIGEPDPEGFKQIGRTPVDERFLENVRALENEATPLVNMTTLPFGFTDATGSTGPFPLNLGCDINTPTPVTTAMGSKLWFNCPSGLTVRNLTIESAGAEVVIAGPLTVNSTGFTIRDARKVWIRGKSNGNERGVDLGAPFVVNNGGLATCAARFAAARDKIGTLFVKEGAFLMAGAGLQLCQTHVYLRGADSPAAASSLPTAVTPPPALPPEPGNTDSLGKLDVGAGSTVDWTAPNELDLLPTLADLVINRFEDLALWTESSDANPLNGGGGMTLGGIFFLPNANSFAISGNAGQAITVDAQFFVRKLDMSGGATLRMVPNPANQVPIRTAGLRLIR